MFLRSLSQASSVKKETMNTSIHDKVSSPMISKAAAEFHLETLRRDMREALDDIRYIAAHCAYESFIESIRDEWKYIAIVIDRLQFIIFSLVTILGSLALFLQVGRVRKHPASTGYELSF